LYEIPLDSQLNHFGGFHGNVMNHIGPFCSCPRPCTFCPLHVTSVSSPCLRKTTGICKGRYPELRVKPLPIYPIIEKQLASQF